MYNQSLLNFIKQNKIFFIIVIVSLFLIELEIFIFATTKSGRKSWLSIINVSGDVIYETNGDNLGEFNKYYFERTFGPLENYSTKFNIQNKPFPFRSWLVAAIGLPIGLVLLLAFIFKAYISIMQFSDVKLNVNKTVKNDFNDSILGNILNSVSQMNIFFIGFLVFIACLCYWIVPDMFNYFSKLGFNLILKFRWFFAFIFVLIILACLWIIYLKYLLVKNSIKSRTEIEKYRINLELTFKDNLLESKNKKKIKGAICNNQDK